MNKSCGAAGDGLLDAVNVAVAADFAVIENDGHGLVEPEHAALPLTDDQPVKVYPPLGTAVHAPIVAPEE